MCAKQSLKQPVSEVKDRKVSSPVKLTVPEWPSYYEDAKATPEVNQVHGMHRRLFQELGRSPFLFARKKTNSKLQDEIARGGCRPKPSREVLIPKASGGTRPLAIGCLEDKIVQQLGAKILEAIYEDSFHKHSYGFRPKRNTHQAIARLYKVMQQRSQSCVAVELDIEKFFNSMDHEKLIEILSHQVTGHHFLRLIKRILKVKIAQKLRGPFGYYGISFNLAKLNHYYYAVIGLLFKWLNRRSQKRSYTWEAFAKRLMFKPLPRPVGGAQLIDITSGIVPELKRKMRSRMRKLRTSGSKRSPGLSPVFT